MVLVGASAWVPTSAQDTIAFLPGVVIDVSTCAASVQVTSSQAAAGAGRVISVAVGEVRLRFDRGDDHTSADSTALVHMNDASILSNLRKRHKQDLIYTYTASVLLAVNPYKEIHGLYGDSCCERYRGRHIGALEPHPYAIADSAYRMLTRKQQDQALLISGESGAGKTETAKIVMHYLAYTSGTGCDVAARIQARLRSSQPILESLGNAATLRNNNSSRFGKYNRVLFDNKGVLVNAGITTYLLESSRVVVHGERERTYHIFYEMLAGLDDSRLEAFKLRRDAPYRLLRGSAGQFMKGFEKLDKQNYERFCSSLRIVGFDENQIHGAFRILAGLLHLGNIAAEDEEGSYRLVVAPVDCSDEQEQVVVDEESASIAATLLGFDKDELVGTLRRRRLQIPGRRSFQELARTPFQFRQALHSFIKAIYKRLFDHVVDRINASFNELRSEVAGDVFRHIGILDIYGFERLQRNSFEQLCINLANERLQQYFVENVLSAEQALYQREGLAWTDLAIPDAGPVVSCISQAFTTLDDYSLRLAKGMERDATDERFCGHVVDDASKDLIRRDLLRRPMRTAGTNRRASLGAALPQNEGFSIRHYAGVVDYETRGWLDKNNDRLLSECEDLIISSTNEALKALADEDWGDKEKRTPFRSISKKYQQDLEALLTTLGGCNLHYIRCFKPNEEQKPGQFNERLMLDQIVQCGTIELVKMMHHGYPNRCSFAQIVSSFKGMLPSSFQRYGDRTFIEALMLAYEVPKGEWALGMSRLFLKAGQLKALEDLSAAGVSLGPEKLAGIVRGIIRKRWIRAFHGVCLSLYLPRFLSKIRAARCIAKLQRASRLAAALSRRMQAARHRIVQRRLAAKRRLAGCFRAVGFLSTSWRQIRRHRRHRLELAILCATTIVLRTRKWVSIGRARALEAKNQRDMEIRQLKDERRRLEEQRKKMEEDARRTAEEEARRAEETRRHAEQEAKRAAEETRKRAEDEATRAEAAKLQLEEEMKEQRKRIEEENRRKAEDEARHAEENRRKAEEEARRAEEQRKKIEEESRRKAEEEARRAEENRRKAEEEARRAEEMKLQLEEKVKALHLQLEAEEQARLEAVAKQGVEARQRAEEAAFQEKQIEAERQALEEEKRAFRKIVEDHEQSMKLSACSRRVRVSKDAEEAIISRDSVSTAPEEDRRILDVEEAYHRKEGLMSKDAEEEMNSMDSVSITPDEDKRTSEVEEAYRKQELMAKEILELKQRNAELEHQVSQKSKFDDSRIEASPLKLSPPTTPPMSPCQPPGGNLARCSLASVSTPARSSRNSILNMSGNRSGTVNPRLSMSAATLRSSTRKSLTYGIQDKQRDFEETRYCWAVQRELLLEDIFSLSGQRSSSGCKSTIPAIPGIDGAHQSILGDSRRSIASAKKEVEQQPARVARSLDEQLDAAAEKTRLKQPTIRAKQPKLP